MHIHQEEHKVSLFGGYNHLLAYFLFEYIIRVYYPSTGVNYRELTATPFALAILAVACRTGFITDNRLARLGQSIEKSRFAHIGPSDNCY